MEFLKRKPMVGILAFMVVLFTMPLGHALMILMGQIFGERYQYPAAAVLGLIGVVVIIIAVGRKSETWTTWLGFFGAVLIWTGWVEFSYVYYANRLGVEPLIENGEVVTKPEYLMMPSSIGILLGTFLYFFLMKDTGCRFVKWFHRNLGIFRNVAPSGRKRNVAAITAMETIYIMWFFYLVLMIAYDKGIFGDHHPVTYGIFFGSLLWSLYLFSRLLKKANMAFAVRYAIPTVIIFWNSVEILGRWGFFKEIWIHPQEYALEIGLIFLAFVGMTVLSLLTPKEKGL